MQSVLIRSRVCKRQWQQLEKQHQEQLQQQQQQQQQLQDASQQTPTQAVPPGSLTVVATLWHPLGAVLLMVDASAAEPAALGLQLSDRIRMLTAITEGEESLLFSCILHASVRSQQAMPASIHLVIFRKLRESCSDMF
jgi:hypothetical protein